MKVLPAALAQDPDRPALVEREAKVLASLNHRNIAQISAPARRSWIAAGALRSNILDMRAQLV